MQFFDYDTINIKLPERSKDSHKGISGKLLIIGGGKGMGGAAILSSEAALMSGTGLVHLHTHHSNVEASLKRNPEIMALGIEDESSFPKDIKVLLFGPGLENKNWSKEIFKKVIMDNSFESVILDAGVLNFLNEISLENKNLFNNLILTPHPGEGAKLLDKTVEQIQNNRANSAIEISKKYNANVILKGYKTIVVSSDQKNILVCSEGGPELATGGTGDVLAGLVSSFVAQGMKAFDSCLLATSVHARAGEVFKKNIGEKGLNASSLIPIVRELINA